MRADRGCIMGRLGVALLALLPLAASAQQVYKCVKDKEVSYQSSPCDDGKEPEKVWDNGSYRPPSNVELWRNYHVQQATQQRDAELRGYTQPRRSTSRTASGAVVSKANGGRCEEAKAHRDRELYKLGPRKSIETLRSWDSYVAKACKP